MQPSDPTWCPAPLQYCTTLSDVLMGAHCALCPRCSKSRLFWTRFPDGQRDCDNYCVPKRRTTQILTQSKNSDNELK